MISVCVATYNGEAYIAAQLESILKQIGPFDEVVVSDDHSSDRTLDIVQGLHDQRVITVVNPNKGITSNFENALKHAKGDYIFLSDQDDIWKPNKVNHCLKMFDNGYNLVISDCEMFHSDSDQILEASFYSFNGSRKGFFRNLVRNSFIGCCMAFDRQVLRLALPFPNNLPMHDSWIGLLAEIKCNVIFLEEKLISYRVHNKNASATGIGVSSYSLMKKLGFRWNLIISIFRRLFR